MHSGVYNYDILKQGGNLPPKKKEGKQNEKDYFTYTRYCTLPWLRVRNGLLQEGRGQGQPALF